MRYEALRGLLVHSPQIETGYAEVVIGNPNKVWLELRRLLAERDRAVELLKQVDRVLDQHVSAKEYLDTQASVRVFLGELEVK